MGVVPVVKELTYVYKRNLFYLSKELECYVQIFSFVNIHSGLLFKPETLEIPLLTV